MSGIIVDASVIVRFLVPQALSDQAEAVFREEVPLLMPDLAPIEVSNAIWKLHRFGNLSRDHARRLIETIRWLDIRIEPSLPILPRAFDIASEFHVTVYDATYVALSEYEHATLATDDQKLLRALSGSAPGRHVRWLGAWSS